MLVKIDRKKHIIQYLEALRRESMLANPGVPLLRLYRAIEPAYSARYSRTMRLESLESDIRSLFNTYLAINGMRTIGDDYGRREDIHDPAA